MLRIESLGLIFLTLAACSQAERDNYVVRLDLDQIAADTVIRDTSPGFSALEP